MKRIYIIKVNFIKIILTLIICTGMIYFALLFYNDRYLTRPTSLSPNADYVVLAMNDLGMHCIQHDYSSFLILPPGNTLKVQVFKREGMKAELINNGVEVKYEVIDNTTSAEKLNFWEYAAEYGYPIEPNVGITGNKLSGSMTLSSDKKYYEVTAIPVTPYNDGSKVENPYQTARVTVFDKTTGNLIATCESVVLPVSDEMECHVCHGETNTGLSILSSHDKLSGTQLAKDLNNNIRHKCSECHADNVLEEKGKAGIQPLSQAMHEFHSTKMDLSDITPSCYNCHPGLVTQCYRGVMYKAGVSCDDPKCHDSMETIAQSQKDGRLAWLQEPDCSNCHDTIYSSNPSILYRNSYLMNAPAKEMDDIIQCSSCHNGPHSEWPSTQPIDNRIPESLQGTDNYINKCSVCHQATGVVHNKSQ